MDIYDYIESNAVKEYLKSINYNFTTEDKCYIVAKNAVMTIEDKIRAYSVIMKTCKDVKITMKNVNETLFELITKHILAYDKFKMVFFNDKNAFYNYIYYNIKEDRFISIDEKFNTYNDVIEDIKSKNIFKKRSIGYKIRIRSEDKEMTRIRSICINNRFEILNVSASSIDSKDLQIVDFNDLVMGNIIEHNGMKVDIPLPFNKGDLVYFLDFGRGETIGVLKSIEYSSTYDKMVRLDTVAKETKNIVETLTSDYTRIDYYTKELKGRHKALKKLIKG